jgi:hypothetical protein
MGPDYTAEMPEGKGDFRAGCRLGGHRGPRAGAAAGSSLRPVRAGRLPEPPAGIFEQKGRHGRGGRGRYVVRPWTRRDNAGFGGRSVGWDRRGAG